MSNLSLLITMSVNERKVKTSTTKDENLHILRISATPISAPKRLTVVEHKFKKNVYFMKSLFGDEIRVAEIRQTSKISP
jgi:hypothetical protein